MNDRNFFIGKIVSVLHGSSTSLNSVLKSIVVSSLEHDNDKKKVIMNDITVIKCIASVFSAWIGQDIFLRIKKYDLNLFISCGSYIFCLISTLFIPQKNVVKIDKNSLFVEITKNITILSDIHIFSYCLLSITANILVICLCFFSASVFIERRNSMRHWAIDYIFVIMTPFRFISYFILNIYILLGGKFKDVCDQNTKDIVIHGYIDGISKISSALICYLINLIKVPDNYRYALSFCLTVLSIGSLFLLYREASLSLSYLYFTIGFSLSTSLKVNLYGAFSSHSNRDFIFSFNMFVSSLIHIILSYLSILRKSDVKQRFKYYVYTSIFLASISIVLFSIQKL